MKTLPAGPLKILLIDAFGVERNAQRGEGKAEPVAIVHVLNGEHEIVETHRGLRVETNGGTFLTYSQRGSVIKGLRLPLRAAFATTAEVTVVEIASPERAEQVPAATEAPTKSAPKKPAAKPVIKTQE